VSSPPGPPGPGQTLGPVVTNFTSVITPIYPGAQPGLVTNAYIVTTNSNVRPENAVWFVTNCVGFTTVTNLDPGAAPCLTLQNLGTITTSNYPNPSPGNVTTNYIVTVIGSNTSVTLFTNCSANITRMGFPATWCSGVTTNLNITTFTNCNGGTTTTLSFPSS